MTKKSIKRAPELSAERKQELLIFTNKNEISIKNLSLLNNAFVHTSYASEQNVDDNEKLEFLGDSVLDLVIADYLYKNVDLNEGKWSKIRSCVVCENALADVALKLELDKYLLVGHGELKSGGKKNKNILADSMEALIAAIYLDCGYKKAQSFIIKNFKCLIDATLNNDNYSDFKTLLQEYTQKRYQIVPSYTLVEKNGPEQDPTYIYTVTVKNKTFGPQTGHSKREAMQNVAKVACSKLGIKVEGTFS